MKNKDKTMYKKNKIKIYCILNKEVILEMKFLNFTRKKDSLL